MALVEPIVSDLLCGPLVDSGDWPLNLRVMMCDLRPRFLAKGQAGRGYRAISRNGRVLLASRLPPVDWIGRTAHLRLLTWHKRILPDEPPEPYGILLCLDPALSDRPCEAYQCRLGPANESSDLQLEVGGGLCLLFES